MAMLADPKRRQKLSSDPRNNAWSNDTNKFGHQLMEKMGWKQGKGLGLNEDGKTSHISVCLKNNTLGLGCSQERSDNWIGHQDDFNDLLNSLNQNHQITKKKSKPQSLQEKSKKAKKRVHYKKFTAGKDLSTYDDHAMNCIMGVRQGSNTPQNQSENASDDEASSEDGSRRVGFGFSSSNKPDISHQDKDFGVVTTTSSNSMQEYFAKKMKALHEKRNTSPASEMSVDLKGTCEVDYEPTAQSNNTEENTYRRKNKKSKRKHKNIKIERYTEEEHDSQDKAMDQDDNDCKDNCKEVSLNSGIKTDKKKKKKRRKVEDATSVDCEPINDKIEKEGSRKTKKTTKKDKKRKNLQN